MENPELFQPVSSAQNLKTKIKNKMNNLKEFNFSKKQIITGAIVLISAMILISGIHMPDGANDPLKLIDYTPEEKAKMAENSAIWQSYQTEIESHEMIAQQLRNEQSKLAKANEDIRNSVKSRIPSVAFQ
jgi:hypothetical protein